jgi:hypothetical protein
VDATAGGEGGTTCRLWQAAPSGPDLEPPDAAAKACRGRYSRRWQARADQILLMAARPVVPIWSRLTPPLSSVQWMLQPRQALVQAERRFAESFGSVWRYDLEPLDASAPQRAVDAATADGAAAASPIGRHSAQQPRALAEQPVSYQHRPARRTTSDPLSPSAAARAPLLQQAALPSNKRSAG